MTGQRRGGVQAASVLIRRRLWGGETLALLLSAAPAPAPAAGTQQPSIEQFLEERVNEWKELRYSIYGLRPSH